jgi:hypothetical protein
MAGIARYMRDHLGFYPTNGKNDAEWKVYSSSVTKVTDWLKANHITGGNARSSFQDINDWVVFQAKELFNETAEDESMQKLLPTLGACESFLYSLVYSVIGSYDSYRKKASSDTRPHSAAPRA